MPVYVTGFPNFTVECALGLGISKCTIQYKIYDIRHWIIWNTLLTGNRITVRYISLRYEQAKAVIKRLKYGCLVGFL